MPLIKTPGKVKNLFQRLRYFVSYRDASTAYEGFTKDIRAVAKSTATANILVGVRASTSGYVAFPGSTIGLGSNASCHQGGAYYFGIPKDTIQAGTFGWFQIGGSATMYFATGATVVAGYGFQAIGVGAQAGNMTALGAVFSGLDYQVAVATAAPDGAAATYTTVFLEARPKHALLTT